MQTTGLGEHQTMEETKNKNGLFKSKTLKWAVIVLAELIILVGVFSLGMKVAFHKARFTDSWMRNYRTNFMPPMGGLPMRPNDNFFMAHGLSGTILNKDSNTL